MLRQWDQGRLVQTKPETAGSILQNNWEPVLSCASEERMGPRGDGGKWVCDPSKLVASPRCLIYSVGSNEDFRFETSMHLRFPHCEIHVFDPTVAGVEAPDFVSFHRIGLGLPKANATSSIGRNSRNQAGSSRLPMDSLAGIVRVLNHIDRQIDILKIDCEGCELFPELFLEVPVFVRQLLIEVHFPHRMVSRQPLAIHQIFEAITSAGYAMLCTTRRPTSNTVTSTARAGAGERASFPF